MDKKEIKSYKSVKQSSKTEEVIINKSRFIGYAKPTMDEEAAKKFIKEVHAKHPEASCICHAYICGMSGQVQRFHDGHEPVGGMPILEVMKMQGMTAITCAVVRYFGGVKLGIGGLARAFSNTASKAINEAIPSEYMLSETYLLEFDYTYQGKIDYALGNSSLICGKPEYLEKVRLHITGQDGCKQEIDSLIGAITYGNHLLEFIKKTYECWD